MISVYLQVIAFIVVMMNLLGASQECTCSGSWCELIISVVVATVLYICTAFFLVIFQIKFEKKGEIMFP